MVNRVTLIGHLGKDPETRRLENGAAVATFSIATSEAYKDTNGEWQKQTEWHSIVAWREKAEQAETTFKKGMLIYVEGKLTHRKYTDQNNVERYKTEIVASYMRFLKTPDATSPGYFPGSNDEPHHSAKNGSGGSQPVPSGGDMEPIMENVTAPAEDLPF